MAKETKEKQNDNNSSGLQDALRRRHEKSIRSLYEAVSRHYKEHLKECGKAECIECGDAKLLIPYYQAEMEKELLETFPPSLSPKLRLSAPKTEPTK